MGAGIAAHIANAGVPVVLLDLGDAAGGALAAGLAKRRRRRSCRPPPARLITHRQPRSRPRRWSPSADWIVEAIVEDVDAKRALYARLGPVRKPGSIVSSNTSTIPLRDLLDGAPDGLRADFMITHFFNPPRYMQLLEIVAGPGHAPGRPSTRVERVRRPAAGQDRRALQRHARLRRQPAGRLLDRPPRSARRSRAG